MVEVESIVPEPRLRAAVAAAAHATTSMHRRRCATRTSAPQPGEPVAQEPTGVYVQLGAFSARQNARELLLACDRAGLARRSTRIYTAAMGCIGCRPDPMPIASEALTQVARLASSRALDLKPVVIITR